MPKLLPDIIYDKNNLTPMIDSHNAYYRIQMYKDDEYFNNYESYVKFIKGIEKAVRRNPRYNKYISYLKKEVKLNRCQVFRDVTDEDADIEMHHGPIFTLFDICAIVLEYFIVKKWKISTFRIADAVLTDHQQNRVQVVMVSTSVHENIHNGDVFINYHQAWGNMNEFIKKYSIAMSDEYKEQVNRYIDRCLLYDSNDFSVLELNKNLCKK